MILLYLILKQILECLFQFSWERGDIVLLGSAKFNQKNKRSLDVPILPGLKSTKPGVGGYLCLGAVHKLCRGGQKSSISLSKKTNKRWGGGQKSPILKRHSLWTAPYIWLHLLYFNSVANS